jgi:hypothetical protein
MLASPDASPDGAPMLRHLDIRDLLIIDRLELRFQPGLNVLTGETGAGKSILLDALGFVLGWRGRADLVRSGASQGEVVAVFDLGPDHPAHAVLEEAGLPGGPELILRRVNAADGRKTAWVNDRRASGEVLRALSDLLVELHGQQDDRGLLDPRNHRAMLDDFGGLGGLRAEVATAWAERAATLKALETAEARLEEMRREEEFLRHAASEIASLAPRQGEEAELDARRRLMQAAEKMREDVAARGVGLVARRGGGADRRCAPLARGVGGPGRRRARRAAFRAGTRHGGTERGAGRRGRLCRCAQLQPRRAGRDGGTAFRPARAGAQARDRRGRPGTVRNGDRGAGRRTRWRGGGDRGPTRGRTGTPWPGGAMRRTG